MSWTEGRSKQQGLSMHPDIHGEENGGSSNTGVVQLEISMSFRVYSPMIRSTSCLWPRVSTDLP